MNANDVPPALGQRPAARSAGPLVVLVLVLAPFLAFPHQFIPKALLDGGDDLLANLPELVYSSRQLLRGEILWTRSLFMGYPLLGEPEFATLYLPKLLLLLGRPVVAYAAYLVLHYVAAEFAAFHYLKSLGTSRLAALFGALSYAYSGFMLGHRAHIMYVCAGAWAPLTLLLFDRARERGGRASYLLAALAFAQVPLCGATQLTVYLAGMIVFLRGALSVAEGDRRHWVSGLFALIPALLISLVQVLPAHHLAQGLATELRGDYALSVEHSFHPALFPSLALPLPPRYAELYSRIGVVPLCAALVAALNLRSAPARIRVWAAMALIALVLMFGRYVGPLSRALHELPVLGVLRGPARHNFELALASSVLSAWGFDCVRRGAALRVNWVALAGLVFAVATAVVVRFARVGLGLDDVSADVLGSITPSVAWAAAFAFAVWVLFASARVRSRNAAWALALMPLLETAWVMRVESAPRRSALGLVEQARATLDALPRPTRLISVSLHRGSVDALAGNSILLYPGVESLQGYVSIVPSDAGTLLDLDMHGQPRSYYELLFSTLPSAFGATHVVLPSIACGGERITVFHESGECDISDAASPASPSGFSELVNQLHCDTRLPPSFRYRLQASVRTERAGRIQGGLFFRAPPLWQSRYGLTLEADPPSSDAVAFSTPVNLGQGESWGAVSLSNEGADRIRVSGAGLYVDREITIAAFGAGDLSEESLQSAELSPGSLLLAPERGEAHAERPVHWSLSERRHVRSARLELEARAASGVPEDLVLDLYSDHGYDPEDAQIVVPGREIGSGYRHFEKTFSAAGIPDDFSLRVFALRGASIEVRRARLIADVDEPVAVLPLTHDHARSGVVEEREDIVVEPSARLADGFHVPVRVFDVRLDAAASGTQGAVVFGMGGPALFDLPRQWTELPAVFSGGLACHHVAALPGDVRETSLFVKGEGGQQVHVTELSATDACSLRGYRNPRPLANGLFLYENPFALPFAYTVANAVRAPDLASTRRALLDFGARDLGTKAIVATDLGPLGASVIETSSVRERREEFVVRADGAASLLVVNERFDADWHATVDGNEVPILRVNGIVRGVVVPEGTHRVRFEYRTPRAVWLGVLLAVLGVAAALVAPGLIEGARQKSV